MLKNAVLKEGFCVIRHPNIRSTEINLYRHDGTRLSDTGNAVYLSNVRGAIEYFLVSDSHTPFPLNKCKLGIGLNNSSFFDL